MEDIIHVRPYDREESGAVESLITPTPYVAAITPVSLRIPISNQLDINQILQANTAKFGSETSKNKIQVDESSLKVQKLVDIDSLTVENFYDQISVVIFTQFKLDKDLFIELLLNQFITHYQWSLIKNFDSVTVILKVGNLKDLKTIYDNVELFKTVSDKVLVKWPAEEIGNIDIPQPEINETKIIQLIKDLIEKNKSGNTTAEEKSNMSLDNYYNNYPVDANELIDVPKSMKSKIINELIRFRSKMLIKEHQKRQSEMDKERIKAKQLLTNIFNNENRLKDSNDMDLDTSQVEPPEEMSELNDVEYDQYLTQKREKEMTSRYNEELRQMTQRKVQKSALLKEVEQLSQYEMNLINNKFKLVDDVKANPQTYQDFIRYRYKSYQSEELRDNEDRELEMKEMGDHGEREELQQKEEEVAEIKEDMPEPNGESNDDKKDTVELVQVPELNEEQKKNLQEKLGELVEQFIGIKEDELIQYLYDNLMTNSLSKEEVYETFDNDTDNLIQDINQFIINLKP